MKKYFTLLLVSGLLFSSPLFAQEWIKMMQDPNVNVHDVQAAFYKWYDEQKAEGKITEDKAHPGNEETVANIQLFKRWEWYMEPRTYPTGVRPDKAITAKNYNEYLSQKALQRSHSQQSIANWTYAGNTSVPNGGGDGRVNRIRFSPVNSNIMYACSPAGGLWVSTNGGNTWSSNTDQLADLATSDVAINPLNPNVMYLATGDGDGGDETTVGVLKSSDGGKTWDTTGMSYTLQTSGPAYTTVNQLLINPVDTSIVLAATSFGFYRSTNSGLTWTNTLSQNIKSIEFEPFHPSVVYAGTYNGTFYRSTNGGVSFSLISAGLPSPAFIARTQLAVSPADSNVVYLLAENPSTSSFYGLYLSTDRGQTFTGQAVFASGAPNLLGYSPTGSDNTGQGWYTLSLAVSPTSADTVLVGGVNIWKSGDKGVTWKLNADWTGTLAPYVHADIHHLIFLPNNGSVYFSACDGGVFEATYDSKASITYWSNISNNLEIAEQYSVGVSGSTPGLTISGWQDNGTNLSGSPWSEPLGGDGMIAFIDLTSDSYMYGEYYNGSLQSSTDGGTTWNSCVNGITENGPWVTRWMQDPITPSTLYAGFNNVWESGDQGNSWGVISTWGGSRTITAIGVAPSNDLQIYAAQGGVLYTTPDGGATWKNITSGLPVGSASITAIAVSPNNQNRVWVTFSGWSAPNKVFQSNDAGVTWTNITGDLPNLPVNCIVYDPGSPDGLYIGTEIGVYYRDTTLGYWIDYSGGLPNVMIDDIKIFTPTNTVVVGTYGRGTWQTAGYVPNAVNNLLSNSSVKVYPNPTNGMVKVEFDLPQSGNYALSITDVLGQTVYTDTKYISGNYIDNIDMSTYSKGVYFLTVSRGNSKLVKKIVVY